MAEVNLIVYYRYHCEFAEGEKKLHPVTEKSLLLANFDISLFLTKGSACATPPSFPYVTLAACFLVTLASAGTWQTSSPCGCLCVTINCPLPSIRPPTHLINMQKWPRISSMGNGQQISWIWQRSPHFRDLHTFPYYHNVTTLPHTLLVVQHNNSLQISSSPVTVP